MLTERQTELLKIIIEEYIDSVKPVGSTSLIDKMNLSSATIRNEMAELEILGLLEKTHTSSGRVPSEKGYRYYVDNVMIPKDITGEDMLKLQTIFRNNSLELNDTILKSMQLISELTNYTAVVLGKSSKDNKVSRIEAIPLTDKKFTTILITDKGHVEHKNILLTESISSKDIKQTVDIINKLIIGTPIDEVNKKLEFEVKPIINQYVKQHEILYNAFHDAFTEFAGIKDVNVKGTKNILEHSEFTGSDRIKEIINKFDDETIINNIEEKDSGINIYIGSENDLDDEVTVIKTKYLAGGKEGTIALIGPKRMEYDRVTSLLEYILENIER